MSSSHLAELHAALVQDALEKKLEESIPAGLEARLAQLPVGRNELRHHDAGLLKTLHPGCARVPVLTDNKTLQLRKKKLRLEINKDVPRGLKYCLVVVCYLELGVVGEARQCEEQTQFAVIVFSGTELLQSVETLHCFLHGELQLKPSRPARSEYNRTK